MALNPLEAARSRRLSDRRQPRNPTLPGPDPRPVDDRDTVLPQLTTADEFWARTGLNAGFVSDLLSTVLAHERGAAALYASAASRTHNSVFTNRYTEFGNQTCEHAAVLEAVLTELGGDPGDTSPGAEATATNLRLLAESIAETADQVDPLTRERMMLDAIFTTETTGHCNWMFLVEMATELDTGPVRDLLERAVERIEAEQDEHLHWVETARARVLMIQARRPQSTDGQAITEAEIERLFD